MTEKTYRIGQLAKVIGVSEHTLRFYEKEGLVIPKRNKGNIRSYTEENRLWIEFLLHMKDTGMTLEDLKRYKALWELGDEGLDELVQLLEDHRANVKAKLKTYENNLSLLDKKIDLYQDYITKNGRKDLFESFVQEKNQSTD
ncbi:MerR family transcriptional regulator [Cytobacillus purgationiresistens]|uniref:DNA-binding transcriptional MerR regulator n=1 Tax=Cytobacillus purgationiresistens TaxID=863449 RepID=A0ABU0AGP7_9BACI|nr:MerR family transcriptional regulator [Cytobacillus purgationiresistens]MDQ0270430.1 DNA-binding transcriptional MerR regulator [Cytobacillus purgationiresistens]